MHLDRLQLSDVVVVVVVNVAIENDEVCRSVDGHNDKPLSLSREKHFFL